MFTSSSALYLPDCTPGQSKKIFSLDLFYVLPLCGLFCSKMLFSLVLLPFLPQSSLDKCITAPPRLSALLFPCTSVSHSMHLPVNLHLSLPSVCSEDSTVSLLLLININRSVSPSSFPLCNSKTETNFLRSQSFYMIYSRCRVGVGRCSYPR